MVIGLPTVGQPPVYQSFGRGSMILIRISKCSSAFRGFTSLCGGVVVKLWVFVVFVTIVLCYFYRSFVFVIDSSGIGL